MKTQNWAAIGESLQSLEESDQRQRQEAAERRANELGKSLALETIVKALVGHMAINHERMERGQAQMFVNILAEDCSKGIDQSQRESPEEEMLFVQMRENINRILGAVVLPKIQGGN